jgi:hypothetical protein
MALRSTYNTGVFGSGLYGEPETTQFSATVALGVSVTASAVTIVEASSTANITTTASQPSGVIIKDAAATVSLGGIVNVSAVTYEVVPGFRPGYGQNTYGSYMYGKNISIEEGSATASISVTPTVSYQVVRQVSASPAITTTFTSNGVIDVVGRASPTISISPDIAYNRVRLMSASDSYDITTDVFARYKWLDADDPTTIWTDASEPSTTWTDADYLERAA